MASVHYSVVAAALISLGAFAAGNYEEAVNVGIKAYENGKYEEALNNFKSALQSSPNDSTLHHWLGKCYARIAENSPWFKAVTYSKKALKQFQQAVELDPDNLEAIRDLISYYTKAPGFLGGSKKKAERLTAHLEMLEKQ